jgi:hypothetical protein
VAAPVPGRHLEGQRPGDLRALWGVFFTVVAVSASRTGRRVGGNFFAVLAGADPAFAIQLLMRFYNK